MEILDCSDANLKILNSGDKNLIIFTHVMFGDLIMQANFFEYLSKYFKTVYVPVNKVVLEKLDIFNNSNIQFILGYPTLEKYRITIKDTIQKVDSHYYINLMSNKTTFPFQQHYDQYYAIPTSMNVPISVNKQIPHLISLSRKTLPEDLTNHKYVFLSRKGSDGNRNFNIPIELFNRYIVISPDENFYKPEHPFYKIAQKYIGLKTSDYISIMENAYIIITLDHGFFHLSMFLDISKVYLAICCQRIYYGQRTYHNWHSHLFEKSNNYLIIQEDKIHDIFNSLTI